MSAIRRSLFKLREFTAMGAGNFLYTAIFYSLWWTFFIAQRTKPELMTLPRGMIGSATLEGYDISARVSVFYSGAIAFFVSFVFLVVAAFYLNRLVAILRSPEMKLANMGSAAGILLLLFQVTGYRSEVPLEFVYLIHKILVAAFVLRWTFRLRYGLSHVEYALVIITGFCMHFVVADLYLLAGISVKPDEYTCCFLGSILIIVIDLLRRLKGHTSTRMMLIVCSALCILPLASVAKDEIWFILKNGNLSPPSYGLSLTIAYILTGLFVVISYLRYRRNNTITAEQILSYRALPLFVFSLVTFNHHSLTIPYNEELFESSNFFLPLMELNKFGVIPVLEKLTGHLASDYFFMGIYAALHGLNGIEPALYSFLLIPVAMVFVYFLLLYLSNNSFFAFFFTLFFPFAGVLINPDFAMIILGLMALNHLMKSSGNQKHYTLLFLALLFLLLWKIDVGVAAIFAIPTVIIYYHIASPAWRIRFLPLLKGFAIVFGSFLLLTVILSMLRGENFFLRLPDILHYCAASQSFGFKTIGPTTDPRFITQYFIFPALVCLLILRLVVRFIPLHHTAASARASLSLLFLCLCSFITFSRGLVRHGFIEGIDDYTAAFAFTILPAAPIVLNPRMRPFTKLFSFAGLSFFLIYFCRFPNASGFSSELSLFGEKIKEVSVRPHQLQTRIENVPEQPLERYRPFIQFINQNTRAEQTFLEFSNKGMLYYYTGKETPAYFYQNPSCSHDDFLQKRFIRDLREYDTPFLAFSEMNVIGYDFFDDVPNQLRHYLIAENCYREFVPYIIKGRMCVWRRRDVPDRNRIDTIFRFTGDELTTGSTTFTPSPNTSLLVRIKSRPDAHVLQAAQKFSLYGAHPENLVSFDAMNTRDAYAMLQPDASVHRLRWDTSGIEELTVIECDHIPDFYSDRHYDIDLRKLPAIWAHSAKRDMASERQLISGPVGFEQNRFTVPVPEDFDSRNGCTIYLSCHSSAKKPVKVTLSYGDSADSSKLHFDVLPSGKPEPYAVRVSCFYNWHATKPKQITLKCAEPIKLEAVSLATGE